MTEYQQIISNLTEDVVIRILDYLKIPWQDKGEFFVCKTACHNIDLDNASWKLYYYKESHVFNCYTSDGVMSIFKFLEHYYETRGIAYDWHQDILQFILSFQTDYFLEDENFQDKYHSQKDKYLRATLKKTLPIYPSGIMESFIKMYPVEWENDNISRAVMDKYNIRFSPSQNKIIIPHYNIKNELIGIRGRALNPWEIENIGKYMPVQIEGKWYSHPLSLNLYGLNMNYKNIQSYGICYVCESEKAILQQEGFTFPNCGVAVCGSQFNKYQLNLLLRYAHPREIVICFDKEEKANEDKYFNKLWNLCDKYKNYCNFSFIYDRNNILNLKDSPTDHGQEVFEELIRKRIKIR